MQTGVIPAALAQHPLFERVDPAGQHTPPLMDPLAPDQPPPRKFRKISVGDEDDPPPDLLHDSHDSEAHDSEDEREGIALPASPLAGKAPTQMFVGADPPIWHFGGPCPECGHVYKTTAGFENHCNNVHADEDVFMEYRPTKTEIRKWKGEEAGEWNRVLREGRQRFSKEEVDNLGRVVERVRGRYEEEWKGLEEGSLLVMRQVGRDFEGRVPWMNYGD